MLAEAADGALLHADHYWMLGRHLHTGQAHNRQLLRPTSSPQQRLMLVYDRTGSQDVTLGSFDAATASLSCTAVLSIR